MIVYKKTTSPKYVFLILLCILVVFCHLLSLGICYDAVRPKNPPGVCPKKIGFRAAQLKVVRPRMARWFVAHKLTPSHEVPKSLRLDESKKFLCCFFLVVKDLPGG